MRLPLVRLFGHLLSLLFALNIVLGDFTVYAADGCTASVSPSSVVSNAAASFSFSITNTGSNAINYIAIYSPSENFSIINSGVPGWSMSSNASFAEIYDGTIAAGATFNFSINASVGSQEAPSANWSVNTTAVGGSLVECTGGPFGTAISGSADVTAPTLSNPTVSGLTGSGVTISWTTNEASETQLDYGLTQNYGNTKLKTPLVTSHSVTLTGLSANTTYFYSLTSRDASGNSSNFPDHNFTTSATSTSTTTSTPAPTTTTTATPTPKATPPPDSTPPKVLVKTDFSSSFEESPLITGEATDNKGVIKIDYSTDGGENWLPVDTVTGVGETLATFEFTPLISEDGNYEIKVRALDIIGNTGTSDSHILVIDRLPPRIGGSLLSLGPQPLLPNKDGVIITLANVEQKITLSAVGGPTSIDLLAIPERESDNKVFSLSRSTQTGLWSGAVNFETPGVYQFEGQAIDGAENKTQRKLNKVVVLEPGNVLSAATGDQVNGGEVKVFFRDPEAKIWTLWDAKSFGQENPQKLSETGGYEYFLPPGTYYVQIKSPGFANFTSKIFSVTSSTPLNANFELSPARTFKIGPFIITLPSFTGQRGEVKITTPRLPEGVASPLIGEEAPSFVLPATVAGFSPRSLRGEPSVLTFFSTWSPQGAEQVSIMDEPIFNREFSGVLIASQESVSRVTTFAHRGGYRNPIAVDADGTLVESYQLTSLPTHFFLNKNGIIDQVVTGVLNKQEITDILDNIN